MRSRRDFRFDPRLGNGIASLYSLVFRNFGTRPRGEREDLFAMLFANKIKKLFGLLFHGTRGNLRLK